ncbi:hypothetical protein [Planotetraspora silvatica]|nr:hypothetical protein [Planotetraspora silvatica]
MADHAISSRSMKPPTLVAPVLLALVLVSACGADETDPVPAPAILDGPSIRSDPDSARHVKYYEALAAIDPEIGDDNPDWAWDRGRDQCTSIKGSADDAKLLELAEKRFATPDHPEGFGTAKNKLIMKAVRQYVCPEL